MVISKVKKHSNEISSYNYHPGTDLYSIITDKITVAMIKHLSKVGKEVRMTWQSDYMFLLPKFCRNK